MDGIELNLIGGLPIHVDGVGDVHPLTLREIGRLNEKKYNELVSLITLNPNMLAQSGKTNMDGVTSFDVLAGNSYHSEKFCGKVELALSTVLKEDVTFISEQLRFFIGELKHQRFVDKDNFEEIVKVVKLQNKFSDEVKKEKKEMSEKAKRLAEKRKKGRAQLAKARGQGNASLSSLISAMGVFTKDINKVLDLTVYQLHDQYERFMRKENYTNSYEQYLVGADPKKLDLDTHWTSNSKANKNKEE